MRNKKDNHAVGVKKRMGRGVKGSTPKQMIDDVFNIQIVNTSNSQNVLKVKSENILSPNGAVIYLWDDRSLFAKAVIYLTKDSAIALAHALETVVKS